MVLFLVSRAVLEGETNGHFSLGFSTILHRPDEVAAGQRRVLVLVRYHGRHLAASQLHSVFAEIVFCPGARVQSRVITLFWVESGLPGTQRTLAVAATSYFTFSTLFLTGHRDISRQAGEQVNEDANFGCANMQCKSKKHANKRKDANGSLMRKSSLEKGNKNAPINEEAANSPGNGQ